MLRFILPIVLFIVLVGFLFVGLYKDPSLVTSPLIDKPVPTFVLSRLHDAEDRFTDQDLVGEVSLLNVWGTWCVACRQEHGMLMSIADSKLIPIYGLNYKDDRSLAIEWLKQYGDPYKANGFDDSGRVGIDLGVYGAPETFLIDREGIIRLKHIGPITPTVWADILLPKINELQKQ